MTRNRKKKPGQSIVPASSLSAGSSPRSPGNPVRLTATRTELQSGPLPRPDILAQYDQVVPGAAERIISMAEHQQAHRMALESTVIRSDVTQARWGMISGFILAVIIFSGAGFLIEQGHDVAGTLLGGLDVASLVGVFVYGTNSRRAERVEKAKS